MPARRGLEQIRIQVPVACGPIIFYGVTMKDRRQPHRSGRSASERHRRSQLAQVITQQGFIRGTLSERHVTCGKPNCRCREGQKHRCLVLTLTRNRRTRQLYVPPAWEDTVRQWVENAWQIDQQLEALSDLHWEKVRKRET